MKGYLLDTNILSELIKKKPCATVLQRMGEASFGALASSVVCVMELRHGAVRHPNGAALWRRIRGDILSHVRVLPLDQGAAIRAGEILADLRQRGAPIGIEDVLIGATALEHDLVVVTRNVRHFCRIDGLAVESWFPSGTG